MFERFTDRARRVLVLAQEETQALGHSFIGTEHFLLGLISEEHGVAAQVLTNAGFKLDELRAKVAELTPQIGSHTGSPPFTPRAKKVLELSLREALQLGHNYISTEHMLLGMIREGEGAGYQMLVERAEPARLRQDVIVMLSQSVKTKSQEVPVQTSTRVTQVHLATQYINSVRDYLNEIDPPSEFIAGRLRIALHDLESIRIVLEL